MKYWWLENYKNFKIIQIKELQDDINYFLTMPKNYEKQYELLKDKDINNLEEEELLIVLKKIVNTKNIKDNSLSIIIKKLLEIPDNSFPASDYTFQEMLTEIKSLKNNPPVKNKLETNNLAICYNCLNIFYVDKIKSVNKKDLCLCPFCLKSKLYFDNDYIPMNYTFIKLANIYYGISNLGCTFKEIRKIVKKNISTKIGNKEENSIEFSKIFSNKKISPIDEKIISKKIHDLLTKRDNQLEHKTTIYISDINDINLKYKLIILIVSIIENLSNLTYLKRIDIILENTHLKKQVNELLKNIN